MRLIDADDLIITILAHDLCDTEQIDKDILEAPTVEAIPIEWLKKWCGNEPYWSNLAMHLIEDWEKSKDARRQG